MLGYPGERFAWIQPGKVSLACFDQVYSPYPSLKSLLINLSIYDKPWSDIWIQREETFALFPLHKTLQSGSPWFTHQGDGAKVESLDRMGKGWGEIVREKIPLCCPFSIESKLRFSTLFQIDKDESAGFGTFSEIAQIHPIGLQVRSEMLPKEVLRNFP
jgi:hypothetical protein